jgi:drug/metabolite transporter (DMT)-like permease
MTDNKPTCSTKTIYLLFIFLILIWGFSWPISKIGLEFMSPLWFASYRLLFGTLAMFIIVAAMGKLHWPTRQDSKIVLIIGFLQVGVFMLCAIIGLDYVDAGRSSILVYTTPIWIVPMSIFFFAEQSTGLRWLGFLLGMLGVAVLFNPLEIDWHNHASLFGNGILLLAALCWAIAILCARHMHWPRAPFELVPWQLLVGTIFVVIVTILLEPQTQITWNGKLLFSLFFSSILATTFAYWGIVVVSKELSPITTSLSLLAVPVCGIFASAWLLHEPITLSTVIAMLFIIAGLTCVLLNGRKIIYEENTTPRSDRS